MKKIITIWLAFICAYQAIAQPNNFTLLKTIEGDIVSFTTDNLDNIYILNSRNQLKKLNANGDSIAVFNDVKKFGKASLIDVSNPLKVLLYYRDFATVLMLDRFLNVVNTIDLRQQNIFQANAIAQSYDNKVWVYDEVENKLKKINEEGSSMQETADFRLLFDKAPTPQKIVDQDRLVYVYDSTQSVFVFDYFGGLKSKIPIQGWNNFQVIGSYIFGSKNDTLYRYSMNTMLFTEIKMPYKTTDCISYSFSNARFYCLKDSRLYIYSFTNR